MPLNFQEMLAALQDYWAKQDCVVLLAAPSSLDIHAVVRNAALVFDAQGVTRGIDANNVVRL